MLAVPSVSLALAIATLACGPREAPTPLRAVVSISLDTLRADYLDLYGYETYETSPVLDAFAVESVVFDAAMASEPWTLTSHMSLFTGLTPLHHGVGEKAALAPDIPTLAELLRRQGFATHGYAEGGYLRARWGFDRGSDVYRAGGRRGFAHIISEASPARVDSRDERLFLFLHTYDVHNMGLAPRYEAAAPYRGMFSGPLFTKSVRRITHGGYLAPAPDARETRYIRATYAEGVREADANLGSLFRVLRWRGIWDRALIIVWSHHGEGLYDHGVWHHNQVFEHTARAVLPLRPGPRSGRNEQPRPVGSRFGC